MHGEGSLLFSYTDFPIGASGRLAASVDTVEDVLGHEVKRTP